MAYPNQIKCIKCGKSIPAMPEDASPEELECDACHGLCDDPIPCAECVNGIDCELQKVED